ncbi:MAG: hypothetical protein GXO36_03160, partial [Chloroflexi bacterium]|nr:hypothetical protein [Chloroflexota bacterium]
AQVDNPDQPTRTLKPLEQRFGITGYTHSDHNPVRLRFSISDPNGNASFDPATWQIRLDDILPGGASLVLPQAGVADPANATRLRWIHTHGYDSNGGLVRNYGTYDFTTCANDPASSTCIRGQVLSAS